MFRKSTGEWRQMQIEYCGDNARRIAQTYPFSVMFSRDCDNFPELYVMQSGTAEWCDQVAEEAADRHAAERGVAIIIVDHVNSSIRKYLDNSNVQKLRADDSLCSVLSPSFLRQTY